MKIKLEGLNFLKVYDVALDIQDKLQLSATNDITIDLFPSRLRFPELFPEDTPFSKERYCQDRLDAIHYLQEIGAISAYQLYKAHFNTWEDKVRIVINKKMFDKAWKQLNSIHKRIKDPQSTSQQIPVTDDITWPDNFQWIDENTYDLAGEGRIPFMAKEDNKNKTKTYFKMMADAKTYVETRKMSKETGEDEAEVKIKLNQIREKIRNLGYHKLLAVEARNDRSQASAYRLVPYPTTIT